MYACETWAVTVADKKRITAFEMAAYRKMMRVSWKEDHSKESMIE